MARQNKFYTLQRGITAMTVFNGDELNGIVNNVIELPISQSPKSFKGYFTITLNDSVSSLSVATPTTDPCVEAYGLPWRWSTFTGCSNPATMPLASYTHRPSAWSDTECGKPYQKRWVKEPHVSPTTPLTGVTAVFGSCRKNFVTWVISTNMWSVSTSVGSTVTEFPYVLRYSSDGSQPYTVSFNEDTVLNIQACQPVTCESILNSLNIYIDQTSMSLIYNDIVTALNTTIKPRIQNYLLTNGHPVNNIDEIVKIKPINGKRYFGDLATTGVVPVTGHGNVNYSLVFIDLPTAYITNCTTPTRTTVFENDFTSFTDILTSVHEDTYKLTIYATTSGATTPNICPASQIFHDALYTGTNTNYPDPYNFAFRNQHIKVEQGVFYKDSAAPNTNANVAYYTDLILRTLQNYGVDLFNYTPQTTLRTLCDSTSATIFSSPLVRVYTNNRFTPINIPVKFENISLRLDKIASIKINFGDNIQKLYTGSDVYNNFYVTYNLPGYKTLNITYTTLSGATRNLQFPNIVNVVSYYD